MATPTGAARRPALTRAIAGLATAVAATAGLAGCSSTSGAASAHSYWTQHRFLSARDWRPALFRSRVPLPGTTPSPRQNAKALRVGALFGTDQSGAHFCTASVVNSPAGNVLITAAHCINPGTGGANRANIVFIPDYVNGRTPHGVWTPERYVMDPRWVNGADPNLDVAFIVLKPLGGQNIQHVVGGNTIAFDPGFRQLVRVTGYPDSSNAPIACLNWTSQQSQRQLRFACSDFTGGTSGSPWITHFNPLTRTGTIIGVIGGYQQGGDTPEVSYSSYLGDGIKQLYQQATAGQS